MKDRIRVRVIGLLEALIGLSILILTVLACVQVLLRYAFGGSLFWVEEVSVMALIWMAWTGASLLWLKGDHIAVDLLTASLSSAAKGRLADFFDLLVAVGAAAVGLASLETLRAFAGIELGTLALDSTVKYYPIPVGAFALALAALFNLWCRRGIGEAPDDR